MTLYSLVRPGIFRLDPERAHRLSIRLLASSPFHTVPANDPRLAMRLGRLSLPNPVGLAAGFDKDAEVADACLALGFGFVEIGTVTPLPQPGNPRPRMFRLTADRAVINRMGFNSGGQPAAEARLAARARRGIVGVNIGANKDSDDRIADYEAGVRRMAPVADYLTINISSPNTPGLRALQDKGALNDLLLRAMAARGEFGPPIFLKLAPDLEADDIRDIVDVAVERGLDALIISNTTIARPPLASRDAGESGGLSGAPLHDLALRRLRDFRSATGGKIPLIGVGGIETAEQAYARIRAGASAIQLYTAMVYEGPGLARRIASGLAALLERDGFSSVEQAVGVDHG